MNGTKQAVGQPRRRFRWLRRICYFLSTVMLMAVVALFYLYYNLSVVVVWFANRANPALAMELDGAGFVGGNRIELRNLSLKLSNANERIVGIEKAVVDFDWQNLWNRRIGSIRVENPHVLISRHLADIGGGQSPEKKTELLSPGGLWFVEEFKIVGGKADIDLPDSPLIRFDFTSTLRRIFLSPETKFSTQPQTFEADNVQILGRTSKPEKFGSIKSVIARFSLDHLAAGRIEELTIQTPSMWLKHSLLEAFGGTSSAAGNPVVVSVSTGTGAPVSPWVVGKLHVENGEVFVKDFGNSVPEASLKFALDEEDVQLGSGAGGLLETSHKAQLWDIRVAAPFAPLDPFFWIGSAQIDFTAGDLFVRRELGAVTITQLDFTIGQKFRSMLATGNQNGRVTATPSQPVPNNASPWKIRSLRIINGRATLTDLGVELPDIGFNLDTNLQEVPLSGDIRRANNEIQEVDLVDLTIRSPHDPFVPVLNFATIRLRFSLAQILDQEIGEVIFQRPTINVGKELFWYADELKRRQTAPAAGAPVAQLAASQSNWRIDKFRVEEGGLVVANAGHAGVAVPFEFSTEADNLRFNDLGDLKLKVKLAIREGDYRFPSYQLKFKQLKGGLDFGLPPDTNARNVVQQFFAKTATWKQFSAGQLWLSVTYDINGIYGRFGGAAYDGYVNGQFDFYMQPDTPWTGWVSGSQVNLKQITDVLAPQNFQMDGPASFDVEVNGLNHVIERLTGNFRTKKPGKLKIGKIDQIIASLPDTWTSIKHESMRITLETLRDFDYTTGNGDFWYAGDKGHLALKMRGPHGSRNFDIALHGD